MKPPKRQTATAKIYRLDSSSDHEYTPQPQTRTKATKAKAKKTQAPTTVTNKKRKREAATPTTNKREDDDDDICAATSSAAATNDDWRHPVSQHVIANPLPMREALLDWYAQVHETRGMPWRKPYNEKLSLQERSQRAYEVWVSEIMLQQTQVVTVIGYYNRWMERFPTIRDLAAADIETVNSLWKGLGYYSRAARLLSGAQKIVDEYDGVFPQSAKEMQADVPGIGRYSSGAISSIAYNHCEPVLDGNITRVLCRVFAINANPKSKEVLDILWAGAEVMVKNSTRPGDINQALIELGATVCKVRNPTCEACPLRPFCAAYREAENVDPGASDTDIEEICTLCIPPSQNPESGVMRYPLKVEKKKAREELDVVCVVEWRRTHTPSRSRSSSPTVTHDMSDDRWFLLSKRPEKGLLAGLHDFPSRAGISLEKAPTDPKALKEVVYEVLEECLVAPPIRPSTRTKVRQDNLSPSAEEKKRVQVKNVMLAGDVIHVFSHIRKTYRVQWVVLEGGEGVEGDGQPPELVRERRERIEVGCGETEAEESVDEDEKRKKRVKVVRGKVTGKAKGKGEESTGKGTGDHKSAAKKVGEPSLRWVRYDDVEKANIGTGVLKVWRLVNELWTGGAT